ncbi:hypothetical protein ACIBHX_42775 [Nonomuraea sp. NPDC050536]|uniref:hypothetical protein n=1 Tax=Nonomuraea sp. NPDC050536 TaxID=3364366 RepID=UPI0037CC8501
MDVAFCSRLAYAGQGLFGHFGRDQAAAHPARVGLLGPEFADALSGSTGDGGQPFRIGADVMQQAVDVQADPVWLLPQSLAHGFALDGGILVETQVNGRAHGIQQIVAGLPGRMPRRCAGAHRALFPIVAGIVGMMTGVLSVHQPPKSPP